MMNFPPVQYDNVECKGGWDQITPVMSLKAGVLKDVLNAEVSNVGGYARIGGYERFDGRSKPSDAGFSIVQVSSFTNTPTAGQTLTGGTSGTTGVIAYVGSDYMVVTKLTTPFLYSTGETVTTAGPTTIGTVVDLTTSITVKQLAQFTNLSADIYRADITAVPGEGSILGVEEYNDVVYAFRKRVGAAFVDMYKSTTAGWVIVDLLYEVSFTNANTSVGEGDTLTNNGQTATIRRVIVQTGTLASGVNSGRLVTTLPTGAFTGTVASSAVTISLASPGVVTWVAHGRATGSIITLTTTDTLPAPLVAGTPYYVTSTGADTFTLSLTSGGTAINTTTVGAGTHTATASNATSTGSGVLTLTGNYSAITIPTGSNQKFEFTQANFSGQAGTFRMYGCDNVNRAFEFDGTYFAPIASALTSDSPKHIKAHKKHLFISKGSSILHSGIGAPFNWTAGAGAGEIATGDNVTGFSVLPGNDATGAMMVGGSGSSSVLYGSDAAVDLWRLVSFTNKVGVLDYTIQNMTETYFMGNHGVTSLQASQAYGNFEDATLTNNIRTFINQKRGLVAYSGISRERSQYRIFFNDGYALYSTIANGKYLGSTQVKFSSIPYCASSGELSTGEEVLYIGATDGYVYQLDKGTSFDGANIDGHITFNWNFARTPRILKRWRRCSIEMQGDGYAEISFGYTLAYGGSDEMQPGTVTHEANLASASWDAGLTWDSGTLFWDSQSLIPVEAEVEGTSVNIQTTIAFTTDYLNPFTINSLIYHYTPRRGVR